MIASHDLRIYVVRPTLKRLDLWSEAAENLIIGTAAQESRLGTYLHQINGPALGIFQVEPATHGDLWKNYLNYRPSLASKIAGFASRHNSDIHSMRVEDSELVTNLAYSTAIARMVYYRVPESLPDSDDIPALATYWKTYFNTYLGRGRPEEFEQNYRKMVN
jgi:hypothetical protein